MHAIISHGTLTTRLKDYYDVYVLMQNKNIIYDEKLLVKAVNNTFKNRQKIVDTLEFKQIINEIAEDKHIQKLWKNYQNKNLYAKNISYEQTIESIKKLINILEKQSILT